MSLERGTSLGTYEILALLGVGGMGEVYRARDQKLSREVAIKVLPEEFSQDKDRVARFEREARLLASVNHPNVATLHGFEDVNGTRFLVMELVEGETLAERIAAGPIPIDEALPLFKQIAEGLEAAHDKDVIHRDLKPANIKIGSEGNPKILDFGLAKALGGDEDPSVDSSQSPTLTKGTALGVIMGTASYMSPEQARGKLLDRRTDIWAFGCCFYEALTGKKTFDGASVTDTLATLIKNEPEWGALPDRASASVRNLLVRCLSKDRSWRLQHIGEARIALHHAMESDDDAATEQMTTAGGRGPWVLAAGMAIVAAAAWLSPEPVSPPRPPIRSVIPVAPADRLTTPGAYATGILTISSDGRRLVFSGEKDGVDALYLREMDGAQARALPGTAGGYRPFFSPDGRTVAFFASGKLRKVALDGGNPQVVADVPEIGQGGTWGEDGTIVFVGESVLGLSRVSASGGPVEVLTTLDAQQNERSHNNPTFLPGRRGLLFSVEVDGRAFGEGRITYLSLETRERRTLIDNGHFPRYAESGHIVYGSRRTLMAAPFDLSQLEVTGPSAPVVEDIVSTPQFGSRHFDVSRTGTLVYVGGGQRDTDRRLVWLHRDGSADTLPAEAGPYVVPRLSPGGRYVSVETRFADDDVWLYDLSRGGWSRRTVEGENMAPVWGPDATQIAIGYFSVSALNLHLLNLDGTGDKERIIESELFQWPTSWSADGHLLAYVERHPQTGLDLWVLPLDGERRPRSFLATSFDEDQAVFSPDGRWLAYSSNETGRVEVFLRSLAGSEKEQVSIGGGSEPAWAKSGRELFYRKGHAMMAVSVRLEPTLDVGNPQKLFDREFPAR